LFDRTGKANIGHALETVVWHELQRRGGEAAYVRTSAGLEVDFHVRSPGGEESLIQVCASLDDPATLAREVRALQDAAPAWPQASMHLVVLDAPATVQLPAGVRLHRATDWLLSPT
jgi:predicted AAA+ superfamily ATPase